MVGCLRFLAVSWCGAVCCALVAAGCGIATVETTAGSDIGKVGIDGDEEGAAAPTAATATSSTSTTSWAPNLPADVDGESAGVAGDHDHESGDALGGPEATPTTTPSSTTIAPATSSSSPSTTAAPTTTTIALDYHEVGHIVFAYADDLPIVMPVTTYETIGFHESGHDGAFQLEVVNVIDWRTLASRGRGTGSRTAADIVVPVGEAVLAPVTGTVLRAGTYTLYCDHSDNFIVIEPEGRPGWELKIFHFEGLAVGVGDPVVAAETMIGSSGRILPFVSQVDEFTAEPSNPHVHIEVIDTSIPDRPSSGGGC